MVYETQQQSGYQKGNWSLKKHITRQYITKCDNKINDNDVNKPGKQL